MPGIIPNKLYFRIGEVARLIVVEPYVLRYWESEFPDIKPSKSKSGQRLYKRRDVEMLLKIKELLYGERYTINGAKKRLKDWGREEVKEAEPLEVKVPKQQLSKQIEAFPAKEEEPDEDDLSAQALDLKGSKTLKKIRKDLEVLLDMVKA
jgi:DNA-binding transcriptional MerR regulator